MKAAAFDYVRPRDLAEAARAIAQGGGRAKLLAGGQSLGPMLNLRLARPEILVDISRLDSLRGISETAEGWQIGAAVTHSQIEDMGARLAGGDMLVRVATGIAYRAIRNRGTIGGSLAHADPAADWPLALAALNAVVSIRTPAGAKRVPADRFMVTAFTTVLADNDIIEAVIVPKLSGQARTGYAKFCRKTGEFPEASAAAVFDPTQRVARVFIGALNGAPQSLPGLAQAAAEKGAAACSREVVQAAVTAAEPQRDPVERRMQVGIVMRALQQVFAS
ncbi:MAG: carbon monoxide dehydrogenase [Alphaproteobacteria bacterium]|nr:carbon monoxide dehydrogenase [Alphaproteobacteria bacterium]